MQCMICVCANILKCVVSGLMNFACITVVVCIVGTCELCICHCFMCSIRTRELCIYHCCGLFV